MTIPRRALIVILNYNGARLLGPCLDSLADLKDDPHVRVVVVDNASPDGSLSIAEALPWVIAIQNGSNLGFAKGNNAILARFEADDYILLNNDTEAHPGWLSAMRAAAEPDDVGLVGAKLLFPDGRIQHAGGMVDAMGPRHLSYLGDAAGASEAQDVDYVTFAAALIKREVIERIGYLDEAYAPMYYEDADYCLRARAAGFRIRYEPTAVLTHHENATARKKPPAARLRIEERNRLRLKFIHFPAKWWARSAWYEAKKWAGNTRDGNARVLAGAWMDNFHAWRALRARRAHPAAFVPSAFSPSDRHAPSVDWSQSAR